MTSHRIPRSRMEIPFRNAKRRVDELNRTLRVRGYLTTTELIARRNAEIMVRRTSVEVSR